ncbi:MAG: hypothetical protein U0136_06515 [Bdellovibrionota bacterium]
MQPQQAQQQAERKQEGLDPKKEYKVPFEQTEIPALSADDARSIKAGLAPIRTVVNLSPTRGRQTIEQVTKLLEHKDGDVRTDVAVTLERIGERLLKDETSAKNPEERDKLRSARYHILSGLAKQAGAEKDPQVLERLQGVAKKLATADEIKALRNAQPEVAERLFGKE